MFQVKKGTSKNHLEIFEDNWETILAQQMQIEKENKLAHYKSKIKLGYLRAARHNTAIGDNKNIGSKSEREVIKKWASFEEFASHDRYGNRLLSYDDVDNNSESVRSLVHSSDCKEREQEELDGDLSVNHLSEKSSLGIIPYLSNSTTEGRSMFIARVRSNTEEAHFVNQSRNDFNEHMAAITNNNGGTVQAFFLNLLSSLIKSYKVVLSKDTDGAHSLREKLVRVGQSLQATVSRILSRTPHFSTDPAFNFARDIISQPVFLSSDEEEEKRMKNRFVFWTLCYHRVVKSYSYDPPMRLFSIDSEVNKERTDINNWFLTI